MFTPKILARVIVFFFPHKTRSSALKYRPLEIDFVRKTMCTSVRVCVKFVKLSFIILHSLIMAAQQFTPDERSFMVLLYQKTGSLARANEAKFMRRFPNRHPPTQ